MTPSTTSYPNNHLIDGSPAAHAREAVAGGSFTAAIYEPFLWLGERRGMRENRRRLLAGARGSVLEIGAGTGLNVPLYPETIDELVLAEPVAAMAAKIEARAARIGTETKVVLAAAEALPFADDSFDTVVSTMVLCTVADPQAALGEVRRVLRPGGRLLFCEHVRADAPRLARWQDRLAGAWAGFAEGCRCDRPTLATIAGQFEVARVERATWRGMPSLVKPLVIGEAVR
jgi:SAM-dependent methyltransferase